MRTVYVVELQPHTHQQEFYVGSTYLTAEERYRQHKRGGKTSVGVVYRRGIGLRYDLAALGKTEQSVKRALIRRGYRVYGSSRRMKPTR